MISKENKVPDDGDKDWEIGDYPHPKYTLAQVLEAVEKGITVAGTARVLGCTRRTVYSYATRWKSVAKALFEKRVELVDLSEMALRGAVLRGEPWAVALTLKTLGKDRGFTERQEIVNQDGQTEVVIKVVRTGEEIDEG